MSRIWLHDKSLHDMTRIAQLHGQKILVERGRSVCDSERGFAEGSDGLPDVDDLVAAF